MSKLSPNRLHPREIFIMGLLVILWISVVAFKVNETHKKHPLSIQNSSISAKVDTIRTDTMNLIILGNPVKGDSLVILRDVRKNLETVRTTVVDLYNGYVRDRRAIDSLNIVVDNLNIKLRKCGSNIGR